MASPSIELPFLDQPWQGTTQEAARALWRFHLGHWNLGADRIDRLPGGWPETMGAGTVPPGLDASLVAPALAACQSHDLDVSLLVKQVGVWEKVERPLGFESQPTLDDFIDQWAVPHAQLLAALAGARGRWQRPSIREVARGGFLVRSLLQLPQDARGGLHFVPRDGLDAVGLDAGTLVEAQPDESIRKVLWRQVIRARDALGQGRNLAGELPRAHAHVFRYWWHWAVDVLAEIERRGFDVWTAPITLSRAQRLRIRWQARFGKSVFKR